MSQQNRRSKRLKKKRQYKERRISQRLKIKKEFLSCSKKCCKKEEKERLFCLIKALNVMQNKGQIPKDAYFEVDEQDGEERVFVFTCFI